MDVRIHRLQEVALHGDIDAFYILITEDVNLLEHIDELPFVDTPLHIAASVGQIAFAREMIGLKPSFSRKLNPSGFSPIHLALLNGHINLVHRLLQFDEEQVRVKGREGMTPLHYAVANGNDFDLLDKFLLACPDSIADLTIRNETALHIALKYDKLDAFKFLVGWLKKNWSNDASFYGREILNWEDMDGNTLLHIAASKNMTQVVRQLSTWAYKIVHVNIKNFEGKTALDILQSQTQVDDEMIKYMLRYDGATSGSCLSTSSWYADYLRVSKSTMMEWVQKICAREVMPISKERHNMLLVVAALLVTVTYQAVLTPPGGFWQDNYEYNTTEARISYLGTNNQTQFKITAADKAGTPIRCERDHFSFSLFLTFNSVAFVFSNSAIFLLLPSGFSRIPLSVTTFFIWCAYFQSVAVRTVVSSFMIYLILISSPIFMFVGAAFSNWISVGQMMNLRKLQYPTRSGLR